MSPLKLKCAFVHYSVFTLGKGTGTWDPAHVTWRVKAAMWIEWPHLMLTLERCGDRKLRELCSGDICHQYTFNPESWKPWTNLLILWYIFHLCILIPLSHANHPTRPPTHSLTLRHSHSTCTKENPRIHAKFLPFLLLLITLTHTHHNTPVINNPTHKSR